MALTPTIETSQSYVTSITGGANGQLEISLAYVASVANFPTLSVENAQSFVTVLSDGETGHLQAAQSFITVVCRGRVDDPKVRVWTYTMDGHDFYVIRLGNIETLVYDVLTGQWSVWAGGDGETWKVYDGQNWLGSSRLSSEYGSNVVVGDDGNGSLYFLDPTQYVDDPSVDGGDQLAFERVFQGQLTKRGYDSTKVFAVELLGSIGKMDNTALTNVTLYYSDDRGQTYTSAGTITIANNDTDKRVDWRSLGSFSSPGRLFKLVDDGALQRIDNLTVETDKED